MWLKYLHNFMRGLVFFCLSLVIVCLQPASVLAAASTSFSIQEDFIGGGGVIDSSSASYKSFDTIGDLGVGDSAGTSYKTQSGYTTTNDPSLSFIVNTSSVVLGALTNGSTATGTATFSVLNYTSYGYIVQVIGNTPSNGAHNLTALASPTASSTGTEQFGINLVANTSPTTFGAIPVQVPSSSFSYGIAQPGYDTTNLYKYVAGSTIASAPKTSGRTDYTVSYIANIATLTPGGSYSGNETYVVVGTY
ncbi:hypothetical protein H0W80_05025 [Candidatus Saccharibacteria bacterium]|nr:hypothetical protein [Candidatus Saccharibacteria bacterium]